MKWYNRNKIDKIIHMALDEDIGYEDISVNSIFLEERDARAKLIAKQSGILAGAYVFERCFKLLDESVNIEFYKKDGDTFEKQDILATVEGDVHYILTGERTALNFLQRMCGVATYTRKMVDQLEGTDIQILDTRKTGPNFRIFEKYAVKVGGGKNHRYNLSDLVLLKDNHIAAAGGIENAVKRVMKYTPYIKIIEVEVENLDMVREALDCKVDIIMLDNMSIEEIEEAVKIIEKKAIIECSGNLTVDKIEALRNLNIDYISSGALTHSSGIIDLSLKELELL